MKCTHTTKKIVIERDTDLQAIDEFTTHAEEVQWTMFKELRTCASL